MNDNIGLLSDKESSLIMQRCYQFKDTINNIYTRSEQFTGSSYTTKFTKMTDNFNDISTHVTKDIAAFPVQPIQGNVYVLLFQVPNVKDTQGINMYIQSFQIPQSTVDSDPITYYPPFQDTRKENITTGQIFYVGFIIYDRYDKNKKLQAPVSAFSETNMKLLDRYTASSAPQCFMSGVGVGDGIKMVAGCASAEASTDEAFPSPYARCYLPPFSKAKKDSAWSYGVLYKVNNNRNMAMPNIRTYFPASPLQEAEGLKCVVGNEFSVLGIGSDGNTYYMESPGSWLLVDVPNNPNIVSMSYARRNRQFFGVGKDNQLYVKNKLQSKWMNIGYNNKVRHVLFFRIWRFDFFTTVDMEGNPKWFGWYTFPNNTVALQTISQANNGEIIGVSQDGSVFTRGGQWIKKQCSVLFNQVIQLPNDTYIGIDKEGRVYTNNTKNMDDSWNLEKSNQKIVSVCVYIP
jgi:hypothetical protein